ncbi:hypothetical protein H5395_17525 [Paracoccus sp. MC1854]|uniref:hypothetical protein n=1 Tax=Paracoccus sp. MC1854 TaxID=2760306 RepID=UPI001603851B|nr:hypothetical protein [Paracoccus sp. MC1854]MBB1493250.1 hypothetical protein [Paracoccus sp. MC1854]
MDDRVDDLALALHAGLHGDHARAKRRQSMQPQLVVRASAEKQGQVGGIAL